MYLLFAVVTGIEIVMKGAGHAALPIHHRPKNNVHVVRQVAKKIVAVVLHRRRYRKADKLAAAAAATVVVVTVVVAVIAWTVSRIVVPIEVVAVNEINCSFCKRTPIDN